MIKKPIRKMKEFERFYHEEYLKNALECRSLKKYCNEVMVYQEFIFFSSFMGNIITYDGVVSLRSDDSVFDLSRIL